MSRIAVVVVGMVVLAAASAVAEPVRPIGALGVSGDLTLSGPGPKNRVAADLTVYVRQRLGLYVAARQVTVSPFADAGHVTAGIAYRAAAARPKLEIVVHADGGVAWPLAPALGGGVTAYLWPLKVPVAVTTGMGAYVIVDGVADTHVAFSLGVGLALAR